MTDHTTWTLVQPRDICDGMLLRIEFTSRPGAVEGTAHVRRYAISLHEWVHYCFHLDDDALAHTRFYRHCGPTSPSDVQHRPIVETTTKADGS